MYKSFQLYISFPVTSFRKKKKKKKKKKAENFCTYLKAESRFFNYRARTTGIEILVKVPIFMKNKELGF